MVLAEARLEKMNGMFELLTEYDDAADPQTLKKMFIYQDNVQREYESEMRSVTKEYQNSVLDPGREVARIEMKGNR